MEGKHSQDCRQRTANRALLYMILEMLTKRK